MKLKTLKELEVDTEDGDVYSCNLRTEAIKDIKAIKEKNCKWNRTRTDVIAYIKWKFNITENKKKRENATKNTITN